MTNRLYYESPELCEFDSVVAEVVPPSAAEPRGGVILEQTAFYPTSGGQVFDTGWLAGSQDRARVAEVAETEDGKVVHILEAPVKLAAGEAVHGSIDPERRRDHMQQHTGQHILSAAFIELFEFPTVSFHMAADYCSIDLTTGSLSVEQLVAAEKRANQIIYENRPVTIRFVTREEATRLGLRKLPPADRDELRLIEIANFDLSACGGTHVNVTGQVGTILLRKTETVRQGMRVEFVCGGRAVRTARRDFTTLSEAANLFSTQMAEVPSSIRKTFDDAKLLRKTRDEALANLAEVMAQSALNEKRQSSGRPVIVRVFRDRDINFAKLFAQKAVNSGVPATALVASALHPSGVVFVQSAGATADMGALLKQVLATVGGRGGGSRDFAQGGIPAGTDLDELLRQAAGTIGA